MKIALFEKPYPAALTSYDVLKSLAVFLMIIDHVGQYFYPDLLWFKVFGRYCVPMWFFLVGYARSRDLSPRMWIGAGILIAADALLGRAIFPLNILVSIIAVRIVLDPLMKFVLQDKRYFWAIAVGLFILIVPTYPWVEYGSLAIILAMFGYIVRAGNKVFATPVILFAVLSYILSQQVLLQLSHIQFIAMTVGVLCVFGGLYFFTPQTYPQAEKRLSGPVTGVLKFTGRWTLEIYVVHLLLFKILAWLTGPGT